MARFSFITCLAFVLAVHAAPAVPDPNGTGNIGNGQGLQFITGGCTSTADCSQASEQTCCAFLATDGSVGICSGVEAAYIDGRAGCGFGGDGVSNATTLDSPDTAVAANVNGSIGSGGDGGGDPLPIDPIVVPTNNTVSTGACSVDSSLSGSQNVGTRSGTQFITGQCFSKEDCASGCCVGQENSVALCKAEVLSLMSGQSCDFSC